MTRDEECLLLYLETRAVDHGGRVNGQHMSEDDYEIAWRWEKEGFLRFGRIVLDDPHRSSGMNWVRLSDVAREQAARLRAERAERMWSDRKYVTTAEKHGESPEVRP